MREPTALGANRRGRALRRAGLAMVFAGAAAVVMPSSASAQEVLYPPSACFNGEAGPRDYVAVSNGPTFFTNVILLCGDPTKGIIHIDSEHPIDPDGADDVNVRDCHRNVMYYGSEVSASGGNRAWQIARPSGGTATVVFDEDTLETVSMFTSDNNNWAACARFPD